MANEQFEEHSLSKTISNNENCSNSNMKVNAKDQYIDMNINIAVGLFNYVHEYIQ